MNSFSIVGRPVADPKLKSTNNSISVIRFDLASNQAGLDTLFIEIVAFGEFAEQVLYPHVKKGRELFLTGVLACYQWTSKDTGKKNMKFYMIADRVKFLGKKEVENDPA